MSTNGETADMVVRESIQITESAVKLAGLGAKNLAALLVAVAKDNPKLSGKTGLKRLIQDGEELAIFSVKQEDLRGFQMESKRYQGMITPTWVYLIRSPPSPTSRPPRTASSARTARVTACSRS